ncbi:MAG TPA: leucyl/phenylalanyl-tRNA--protein transferase [Rhizomicrobium sp.]|jgi:leucyl/phenylalanyl-tRNA--protein transferase
MHAPRLTPELLLQAYRAGIFPMAERRDDPSLFWVSPDARGIFPLDKFHLPRRLARTVKSDRFTVRIDTAFREVMQLCAAPAPDRHESWINDEILSLYTALHKKGHAHSVECWREGKIVGGLYGVKIGAAFFGESMFSRERDASKVALAHLVARLKVGGFRLLDAQFITSHLQQFGAIEIPRDVYLELLAAALARDADFYCPEPSGNSGIASLDVASGDVALTFSVEAISGNCWPGWLVAQLITQAS